MSTDWMRNPWKMETDRAAGNVFTPGRTSLAARMKGGTDWGHMYDQFGGDPYMNTNDALEQLLQIQHDLSPMRAHLRDEPSMRQEAGPPEIDEYGKLRFPDVNVPLNWRLREIAPWWGGEQDEKPRPGGAPSGLYDFPIIGKATGSQYRPAQKQRASQKTPRTRFGEEMSMKSWVGDLVKELSRALTQKAPARGGRSHYSISG